MEVTYLPDQSEPGKDIFVINDPIQDDELGRFKQALQEDPGIPNDLAVVREGDSRLILRSDDASSTPLVPPAIVTKCLERAKASNVRRT